MYSKTLELKGQSFVRVSLPIDPLKPTADGRNRQGSRAYIEFLLMSNPCLQRTAAMI